MEGSVASFVFPARVCSAPSQSSGQLPSLTPLPWGPNALLEWDRHEVPFFSTSLILQLTISLISSSQGSSENPLTQVIPWDVCRVQCLSFGTDIHSPFRLWVKSLLRLYTQSTYSLHVFYMDWSRDFHTPIRKDCNYFSVRQEMCFCHFHLLPHLLAFGHLGHLWEPSECATNCRYTWGTLSTPFRTMTHREGRVHTERKQPCTKIPLHGLFWQSVLKIMK